MQEFMRDMRTRKLSVYTIDKRVELVERLRAYLKQRTPPLALLDADVNALRDFQSTFAHRAPATIDIYTRHAQAFYRWAAQRDIIGADPAAGLIRPRVPKGRPHPIRLGDVEILFACTTGVLRIVFALAVFAGLRRGEICRLQRRDIDIDGRVGTALIHGKGGKERIVPLIEPVVAELRRHGLPRHGYVVLDRGRPYDPETLTVHCYRHLQGLGLETTLHSGRHTFGTQTGRKTKDPMLVRMLMGHESLDTTLIYMEADMSDAHERLSSFSDLAGDVLGRSGRRLRVAGE